MARGAWWAMVYGVTKERDTTERLNNNSGREPRWMGWGIRWGILIQAPLSPAFSFHESEPVSVRGVRPGSVRSVGDNSTHTAS